MHQLCRHWIWRLTDWWHVQTWKCRSMRYFLCDKRHDNMWQTVIVKYINVPILWFCRETWPRIFAVLTCICRVENASVLKTEIKRPCRMSVPFHRKTIILNEHVCNFTCVNFTCVNFTCFKFTCVQLYMCQLYMCTTLHVSTLHVSTLHLPRFIIGL